MRPIAPREFDIVAPPLRTRRPETVIARHNLERLYRFGAGFLGGYSQREQARLLRQAIKRLREGGWRHERTAPTCPRRHRGKIAEVAFAILRLRDAVPSERTIRRALSVTRGPRDQR